MQKVPMTLLCKQATKNPFSPIWSSRYASTSFGAYLLKVQSNETTDLPIREARLGGFLKGTTSFR